MQQTNQLTRPNGLFIIFRLLNYMPYVAIGILIIAVAIWIIFGIKKFRWAKITAIVLTVLVVITGLLSLGTLFLGRFKGGFPGDRIQIRRFEDRRDTGAKEGVYRTTIDNMEIII